MNRKMLANCRMMRIGFRLSSIKATFDRSKIKDLSISDVSRRVQVRARVQSVRSRGKQCFLVLRQDHCTVQGFMSANIAVDTETILHMIKTASNIKPESIVEIEATVAKAAVKACTLTDIELHVNNIDVICPITVQQLPFSVEDAQKPDSDDARRIMLDTRLNNRVMDLRTCTNHAIFKMQAGVGKMFRQHLESHDFMEIHTPKLISAASEGGSNVFSVPYFKTNAYLAQSPQLYKQMMICSDFEKVYEIGPVFRAENSLSHRHMTEFVGLDLEMTIDTHYHEVLDVFDKLFVSIFKQLKSQFANEIKTVQTLFPSEEFQFLEPSLRLDFKDAISLLRDNNIAVVDFEDFNTETERALGRLVKEKYKTDFFILDKYPLVVRPFYTMPDPERPGYSNSYDVFMRGEEVMSGAQRIHDPDILAESAKSHGIDVKKIKDYLDAFKYGCLPHGGGGIGLERVVMLYLDLKNIRRASLFPRDPRRLTP